MPAAAIAASQHSTSNIHIYESVRPEIFAEGGDSSVDHNVQLELATECPEFAGAGEDVMESDSGSAKGSDEEATPREAEAHVPEGDEREVREDDDTTNPHTGEWETLGEE